MIIEVLSPAYPLYPLNLYNRVDQLNLRGKKLNTDSKWEDPMLNENSQRIINLNKLQILFPAVPVVSAISTSLRTCV